MERPLTGEVLTIEKIPQEIIDELAEQFDIVNYELGTSIDDQTITINANYKTTESVLSECQTVDYDLMLPVIADGYVGNHYIIRYNVIDNGISVAEISIIDVFTIETVITELEIPTAP